MGVVAVAWAPGAHAEAGGAFSVAPAHSDAAVPATRAYFIQTVRRGGRFDDEVLVDNQSPRALTLRVYAVDGLTSATSGAVFSSAGQPLRADGRWLTLATVLVSVPVGRDVDVPFTLRVPTDATAGDHLAGIAVQAQQSPARSRGRFGVIEVLRSVVAIEIHVPGRILDRVSVGRLALQTLPDSSASAVMVTLRNAGDQFCRAQLLVGLRAHSTGVVVVQRRLGTILPGDAIDYRLVWPHRLAAGTYVVMARASGCGRSMSARAAITVAATLPGTATHPRAVAPARAHTSGSRAALRIVILVGAVGVVAGVAYAVLRRRGGSRTGV